MQEEPLRDALYEIRMKLAGIRVMDSGAGPAMTFEEILAVLVWCVVEADRALNGGRALGPELLSPRKAA